MKPTSKNSANVTSHFVIIVTLCNTRCTPQQPLSTLCNTRRTLLQFSVTLCNNFFTLCNSHRMDLDPKLGSWNLKIREPSSRKRDSKSRHRVQVLESRTLDSGPRTKTQDLTTLTKV